MIMLNETGGGDSQDFARFVELQQKHTQLSNQLEALEVKMNESANKAATAGAEDYVVIHEELSKLDTELKSLFERHPEWRGEKKSVGTPFGSVEQRTATELQVENPAQTVALIELTGKTKKGFDAESFLHISKEPNLEALEQLGDEALAEIGVKRVRTERITVKPAKVSVAKAVKAAKKTRTEVQS